jgi:hypothetical protein
MNRGNLDHAIRERNIALVVESFFGNVISIVQERDALADARNAKGRYIEKDISRSVRTAFTLMIKDVP